MLDRIVEGARGPQANEHLLLTAAIAASGAWLIEAEVSKERLATARELAAAAAAIAPDFIGVRTLPPLIDHAAGDYRACVDQLDKLPIASGTAIFQVQFGLLKATAAARAGDKATALMTLDDCRRRLEQSFLVRGDLGERAAWDVGERLGYLAAELAVHGREVTPPLTPQRWRS